MTTLMHRSPTVGSVIKKIMAINPDLNVQQVIDLVRESIYKQDNSTGDFASAEVVDETKALRLARASLPTAPNSRATL